MPVSILEDTIETPHSFNIGKHLGVGGEAEFGDGSSIVTIRNQLIEFSSRSSEPSAPTGSNALIYNRGGVPAWRTTGYRHDIIRGEDHAGNYQTVRNLSVLQHPVARVGKYFAGCGGYTQSLAGYGLTGNRMYALPCLVWRPMEFDAFVTYVGTAEAGKTVRMGLYSAAEDDWGSPDELVAESAPISVAITGWKIGTLAKANTLDPGFYWIVVNSNTAGTLKIARMYNYAAPEIGRTTAGSKIFCVYRNYTFGAFPSNFGTITADGINASRRFLVMLRIA